MVLINSPKEFTYRTVVITFMLESVNTNAIFIKCFLSVVIISSSIYIWFSINMFWDYNFFFITGDKETFF